MSRPVLLLAIVIAACIAFTNAANYNMIVEPLSNVVNFPLDGFGEFEFSYATADDISGTRTVLIAFDLEGTQLQGDSCYIGNGLVQSSDFIAKYLDRYTVVRAPVDKDNFYQVVCRFKTPSEEKVKGATKAFIAELPPDTATEPLAKVISEFVLGAGITREPTLQQFYDVAAMVSDVEVPNLITEEPVFSFKYVIEPQGRKLLNSTEIDFIRQTHGSFVNIKNPDQDVLDYVLAVDHYAQVDYSGEEPKVVGLVLNIYTKGTTSQFDFALGLERRVKPLLAEYSNKLGLVSLSYDVSWVYRSNCFNNKFDEVFGETAMDCGNPLVNQCGHCTYIGRTDDSTAIVAALCSDATQCASGICDAGTCDMDLGTFIPTQSTHTASALLALVLVTIAVFIF